MNTKLCPICSNPIRSAAPGGFCPACLLRDAQAPPPSGQPAPSLEQVAAAFPTLEVCSLIGQGGMGSVYKVRQPSLDRAAALKLLAPELSRDPAFAERFAREARVLGKLNHPNIVSIYEHGESGEFYYLLMEYVDGVNLRQAMRAGRFSPEQALAIVPGICDALQAAHAQGVWHRDIKPENILLDQRGGVKIVDFGIARLVGDQTRNFTLTGANNALGSVAYMAPEQHESPHNVDHRADIYSLGVVIYEMLTGELPLGRFPAPSQRAAVSARIDEIVFQTLEKERELRHQSAAQVKTDVQSARHEPETEATPRVKATGIGWIASRAVVLASIALFVSAAVFTRGSTQGMLFALASIPLVLGLVGMFYFADHQDPRPEAVIAPKPPAHSLKSTVILHFALFALLYGLFFVVMPRFDIMFNEMGEPRSKFARMASPETILILLALFGLDVWICVLARKTGGRRGLRRWTMAVAGVLLTVFILTAVALWMSLRNLVSSMANSTPAPGRVLGRLKCAALETGAAGPILTSYTFEVREGKPLHWTPNSGHPLQLKNGSAIWFKAGVNSQSAPPVASVAFSADGKIWETHSQTMDLRNNPDSRTLVFPNGVQIGLSWSPEGSGVMISPGPVAISSTPFLEWAQGEWGMDRDETMKARAALGISGDEPQGKRLHLRFTPTQFEMWNTKEGVPEAGNAPSGFRKRALPTPDPKVSPDSLVVDLKQGGSGPKLGFSKASNGLLRGNFFEGQAQYLVVFKRVEKSPAAAQTSRPEGLKKWPVMPDYDGTFSSIASSNIRDIQTARESFKVLQHSEGSIGALIKDREPGTPLFWGSVIKTMSDQMLACLVGGELEQRAERQRDRCIALYEAMAAKDWAKAEELFKNRPDETFGADLRKLVDADNQK